MIRTEDHGTWLTVAEAAQHYGVAERTIRWWTTHYHLDTVHLYGTTHINDTQLATCDKARRDTRRGRPRNADRTPFPPYPANGGPMSPDSPEPA